MLTQSKPSFRLATSISSSAYLRRSSRFLVYCSNLWQMMPRTTREQGKNRTMAVYASHPHHCNCISRSHTHPKTNWSGMCTRSGLHEHTCSRTPSSLIFSKLSRPCFLPMSCRRQCKSWPLAQLHPCCIDAACTGCSTSQEDSDTGATGKSTASLQAGPHCHASHRARFLDRVHDIPLLLTGTAPIPPHSHHPGLPLFPAQSPPQPVGCLPSLCGLAHPEHLALRWCLGTDGHCSQSILSHTPF